MSVQQIDSAAGPEPALPRSRPSRGTLLGLFAAGLVVLVVGAVLALGHGRASPSHRAAAHPHTAVAVVTPHAVAVPHAVAAPRAVPAPRAVKSAAARSVVEVRDPEEAKSFPVPGSVHHKAAAKPATVAEEIVAPGAPSNAEVRQELGRMHAVERAAKRQEATIATTVPGGDSVGGNGQIPIPQDVPEVVQRVIAGANAIADFPYVYGGGHASFVSNSYDCSGSVSYALAAGGLLGVPETSGQLESWGEPGPGKWITVYANAGHVYMYVNIGGRWMRYDTVGRSGVYASRWQPEMRSNAGFVARHWPGL